MSKKHRTREQKFKTQAHRGHVLAPNVPTALELQVEQPKSYVVTTTAQQQDVARRKAALGESKPSPLPPMSQSLLRVDKKYLIADMRRSAVVSSILFAVLIGIFLLVRYNGLTTLQSQFYSITQSIGK